jgi:hypothetical protein
MTTFSPADIDPFSPTPVLSSPPTQPCSLLEPCGALISRGRCATSESTEGIPQVVITHFDRPGQLVQRCLTGSVRTVWVHLEDGRQFFARVEHVAYDPKVGRRCLLRRMTHSEIAATGH